MMGDASESASACVAAVIPFVPDAHTVHPRGPPAPRETRSIDHPLGPADPRRREHREPRIGELGPQLATQAEEGDPARRVRQQDQRVAGRPERGRQPRFPGTRSRLHECADEMAARIEDFHVRSDEVEHHHVRAAVRQSCRDDPAQRAVTGHALVQSDLECVTPTEQRGGPARRAGVTRADQRQDQQAGPPPRTCGLKHRRRANARAES